MTHSGLTIFVIFFGVAVIDAIAAGAWTNVAFWVMVGILFAILEHPGRRGTPRAR